MLSAVAPSSCSGARSRLRYPVGPFGDSSPVVGEPVWTLPPSRVTDRPLAGQTLPFPIPTPGGDSSPDLSTPKRSLLFGGECSPLALPMRLASRRRRDRRGGGVSSEHRHLLCLALQPNAESPPLSGAASSCRDRL